LVDAQGNPVLYGFRSICVLNCPETQNWADQGYTLRRMKYTDPVLTCDNSPQVSNCGLEVQEATGTLTQTKLGDTQYGLCPLKPNPGGG
jgi:hypothetical protein